MGLTTPLQYHPDALHVTTRIPEGRKVQGLEYGAHVSATGHGWTGHYVRPTGSDRWAISRLTPADDELEATDAATVEAIHRELAG